jgi:excisionase family DNA binding protein
MTTGPTPLAHSVADTATILSIGKSTVWALVKRGQLETVKLGRRTLVRRRSILRLVGGTQEMPDRDQASPNTNEEL